MTKLLSQVSNGKHWLRFTKTIQLYGTIELYGTMECLLTEMEYSMFIDSNIARGVRRKMKFTEDEVKKREE